MLATFFFFFIFFILFFYSFALAFFFVRFCFCILPYYVCLFVRLPNNIEKKEKNLWRHRKSIGVKERKRNEKLLNRWIVNSEYSLCNAHSNSYICIFIIQVNNPWTSKRETYIEKNAHSKTTKINVSEIYQYSHSNCT